MGAPMTKLTPEGRFPVAALIAEAQRELDLRRQFYWARVRAGKMRQDDAHLRIALMEAIVKRLTVTAAL
jgi:hypothetical protein